VRPEQRASAWARLGSGWTTPLLRLGASRPLTEADLFELEPGETAEASARQLDPREHPSIVAAVWATQRGSLARVLGLGLLHTITAVGSPLLLRELLAGLASGAPSLGLVAALVAASAASWLTLHHAFWTNGKVASRVRSALMSATFRKALALAPEARRGLTAGHVVNLLSGDVEKACLAVARAALFVVATAEILLALMLLVYLLGWPGLTGAVVLALSLPLSSAVARQMGAAVEQGLQRSDQRLELLHRLLSSVRAVKASGWERAYTEPIEAVRELELRPVLRLSRLSALVNLIFLATPVAVTVATFAVFTFTGGELVLADVLAVMAIFGILRPPVLHIPAFVAAFVDGLASMRRLEAFFASPEQQVRAPALQGGVSLREGSFAWREGEPVLRGVDLEITPGEWVAVVGPAGGGKSSLLAGLAGELHADGRVEVGGPVAWASQIPWIPTGTLQDAVLLGRPLDEARLAWALSVAGLEEDVAELPLREQTPVGERGAALSGGQRQRVALARALYGEASVYLLDDPFSALDERVARSVFEGLRRELAGRTCVVATHRLELAQRADRVIVVEGGRVVACGTPAEVVARVAPSVRGPENSMESEAVQAPREEAEGHEQGAVRPEVLAGYLRLLGPGALLVLAGLFAVREVIVVASDLWLARQAQGPAVPVGVFLGGLLGLLVAGSVVTYARAALLGQRGVWAARQLHAQMLGAVSRAPLHFFETTPAGRILNRFGRDQELVDKRLPAVALETLTMALTVLSSLAVVVTAAPAAVLAIVPLGWVYWRIQGYFRASVREINRIEAVSHSPLFVHLAESFEGAAEIGLLGTASPRLRRFQELVDISARAVLTRFAVERWLSLRLDLLGVALTGVASGLLVVLAGSLSAGLAGLAITYTLLVTGAFAKAVHAVALLEASLNAVQRIAEYGALAPEPSAGRVPERWPSAGRVELVGLSVRYRPDRPLALAGLTVTLPAGAHVAVVGRTGSGKSTLVASLLRLVEPEGGLIRIDGIDIGTVPPEVLRSRLCVVPQEGLLLPGSVRRNLDPWGQHSDEALWTALEHVKLARVVREHGLQADLDEVALSVGQRQLLCLARVLLCEARVVLLDEADAQLDPETHATVRSVLAEHLRSRTVITIAHRLQARDDFDTWLVLERGRLAETRHRPSLQAALL
jgi:ABC-type multidrug transport system fused ATPase/permease subunit